MNNLNKRKRRPISRIIALGLLFIWILIFAALFLMPTILTLTNSFMSSTEISANYGVIFSDDDSSSSYISERVNLKFIPDLVTIKQYITIFISSPDYLLKFWNSVLLTAPVVIFQTFIAALAAYGFARYTGKYRELIFFGYVVLMLMPIQVTLVPNYVVSKALNILDTRWSIILPGIFSPFAVFILTKSMRRIPKSLYEAAWLDGANE